MYELFFGLSRNPFSMTADPGMLYITTQHREALAALSYGITARKGMMALTGEAGTGKTSLLMRLTTHLHNGNIRSSIILNPHLSAGEMLEMIMTDFGLADAGKGKAKLLQGLQQFLLENFRGGRICLLIVDEAHRLSADLLEELRLLGNFETPRQKLLQIVLCGQPELASLLNTASMRQVKQRISLRARLLPLSGAEVATYVDFRWSRSAQSKAPFSAEALAVVAEASSGIPRLINALCDNALITAFAERSRIITPAHVAQAAMDLDLSREGIDDKPCLPSNGEGGTAKSSAPSFCGLSTPENHRNATSFLTRFRHGKGSAVAEIRK